MSELQELLDRFRTIYNQSRPHRSLGRLTPGEVWAAQPPAAPPQPAGAEPVFIRPYRVAAEGTLHLSGRLGIGLGVEWAYRSVTLVRRDPLAIVIDTATGEIIRELTIDPARSLPPPEGVNDVSRHPCQRCRATSQPPWWWSTCSKSADPLQTCPPQESEQTSADAPHDG